MKRVPAALALVALAAFGLLGWFFGEASEPEQRSAAASPPAAAATSPEVAPPPAQAAAADPAQPPRSAPAPAPSSEAAGGSASASAPEGREIRLRVSDPAGAPLQARVETLTGELLGSGRGVVALSEVAGRPVRVSAPGHLARVLLPASPADEVTLIRGRVLRGEVVAAEDGRPLAGARVEALEGLARGDGQGRFELVVPDGDRVEVLVTAEGRPATRARETTGILRVEVPRGVGARGRVVRSDRRAPGPTRLLVVGGQQLHRSFPVQSDAQGNFELAGGLSRGEQVMIYAWSEDGWQSARAPRWQAIEGALEVVLEEPASLILPRPGVVTPVHLWAGEPTRRAPASRHERLAPGAYTLEVPGEDPLVVELAPGETRHLEVQPPAAPRSASLRIRVVDEHGASLAGAEVHAQFGEQVLSARADESGLAELALPRAALETPLTISGRAAERVPLPAVAEVGAREVELVLARRATLDLRVQPPQALEVTVFRREVSLTRARTGSDGRLRLEGLPAGEVRVVLESARGEEIERRVTLPLEVPLEVRVP